ncbi:MAG TPA: serine hydrolase [Gemmatimonadaceae bacterium]|nr:serine hydrolase [Gemmatimonadaceae bacterium]
MKLSFAVRTVTLLLCCAAQASVAQSAPDSVPAAPRYAAAVAILERFVAHEMADKNLPALSISLVEDQRVVWARGFGYANPRDSVRATARTVYRVGSVSKLFTDIAVMQLVERRTLDLDAPVTRYLPDFKPAGAAAPVTLRELTSHRSGLVREPPVGHYFDHTAPTLAATVASLNQTRLVYQPKARSKYSNAGIAVVGDVLATVAREPFAEYLARVVLRPMGLDDSAFLPDSALVRRMAAAVMWTLDGRSSAAPGFQLGMAPAGSMYSTVLDLGRFMSVLFAGGQTPNGRLLRAETLEQMWTPQFVPKGTATGFGIGFDIDALDGRRTVRHGGAIYGFATELAALPDDKLGVAVAITKDGANVVASRIATAALQLMRASVAGRPLTEPTITTPIPAAIARRIDGVYGTGSRRVDVIARDSAVTLTRTSGMLRSRLRVLAGDTLVTDDELAYGARVRLAGERLIVGRDTLTRVARSRPRPLRPDWRGLIGEYGWDFNTLYILERDGELHALIEWFFDYPLKPTSGNTFSFPPSGLYDAERVTFTRRADGYATGVKVGGVEFPRRPIEGEDGATFRLTPQRPLAELRREALAASPPVETGKRASDLVDLATLDPTIRFDIRYATTNNFISTPMYSQARAFMQRPAAEALRRAHQALAKQGFGLLIHDAYRPWYVTRMFWDATPDSAHVFVADPSQGSRHNRGAAVDLTLFDRATGRPIQMVSGYDEFSGRAYPDYPGGTSLQRYHREVLRRAMEAEGFRVYDAEWWHFDYQDWRLYPIGNQTFDQIKAGP